MRCMSRGHGVGCRPAEGANTVTIVPSAKLVSMYYISRTRSWVKPTIWLPSPPMGLTMHIGAQLQRTKYRLKVVEHTKKWVKCSKKGS